MDCVHQMPVHVFMRAGCMLGTTYAKAAGAAEPHHKELRVGGFYLEALSGRVSVGRGGVLQFTLLLLLAAVTWGHHLPDPLDLAVCSSLRGPLLLHLGQVRGSLGAVLGTCCLFA